jgi:pimeloyl-ACP methyl ester carboxylesterase
VALAFAPRSGEEESMALTATVPGLYFESAGEAGPPVLLVMGLGMRGKVWEPQVDDLSRDHRVVTFDNRGVGESAPITGHPTMRDFARDALRVADEVGFDEFHLVGVSMGGMISQELALHAPARVRSLTLIATHAGGPLGMAPTLPGLTAFVRSALGPQRGRVRALQELLYTPEFLDTVDKARLDERMKLQVGKRAPRRTVLGQIFAVARHDTRERLGGIAAPTLVVRPGRDVLVRPMHSTHIAGQIPGARLVPIDDAAHGVTFQSAERLSAAIRDHIAAVEGARRGEAGGPRPEPARA